MDDKEKVEYMKSLLISRATGGSADQKEYQKLRGEFLINKDILSLLPSWIRTTRDLDSFWTFIKGEYGSYQERRAFIHDEFSKLLDFLELGILPEEEVVVKKAPLLNQSRKDKVFIVHGRDEAAKEKVARFVDSLDLKPIILHEQASAGMTIIEKIEYYSNEASYGIVLYTPCDQGRGHHEKKERPKDRARQNVIFEHGYLMAKLGRKNVCALVKGDIETPNDISGVIYVSMDDRGWEIDVKKELKVLGYNIKE